MSTKISAPYPEVRVTMLLPNVELDDSMSSEQEVLIKRSMLGRTVSYVKSNDRHTLKLPFTLTRMKALELEAFIRIYTVAQWKLELYDGTTWIGRLVGNPFERNAISRTFGKGEIMDITLELSAEKQ